MDGPDAQRWERLLTWLRREHGMDTDAMYVQARNAPGAGRGLFAVKEIPASTLLFQVPSTALMNGNTVPPLYPQIKKGKLSAVQFVSLHLLLHKPAGEDDSLDSTFGPYISTLPRDFSSHPLTWFARGVLGKPESRTSSFLDHLPPSTLQTVVRLHKRFRQDFKAVVDVMAEHPDLLAQSSRHDLQGASSVDTDELFLDYLWAWLNVNTRCIYHRIRSTQSDPDNFTLCPVLDFANHRLEDTHIFPVISSDAWGHPPPPGRKQKAAAYAFFGPSSRSISEGQELFLKYGSHSNRFLFAEYGFANSVAEGDVAKGDYPGEIDVQEIVEQKVVKAGPAAPLIRSTLEDAQYWGEWTLDSTPAPAHPSWRLISALRLLCALEGFPGDSPAETQPVIREWMDVTNGLKSKISQENEDQWRARLTSICEVIQGRARQNLSALHTAHALGDSPGWFPWMLETVRTLWREELEVAEGVLASVQAGIEF
ncbi:SET domain-containing protein [Trametes elegans]|nr:SET domain-containing protein [Trametes elegans]